MNLQHVLIEKIRQAMTAAELPHHFEPQVRPATKPLFGDYQVNGMMIAAKQLGVAPRQLATQVVAQLDLTDIIQRVDIAGPGFINIFLAPRWLSQQADNALADPKLNVTPAPQQTIVVDYSGPNVAKEMAVHHIRSTVIGDAMVRTLQRLGHKVIKANHIGDWGTQFGMLIAYLETLEQQGTADTLALSDLEAFYRNAKLCFDNDPAFATRARYCVVQLQQGDPACLAQWDKLVAITMTQNQAIYQRLNVLLTPEDTMAESLYNLMLPMIVNDLKAKGIAVESDGALVVFLDQLNNKQGDPMGVIIQKSDGGFLYSTTDIACAKYRYDTFKPDRILYYVDSRQQQHLTQAWAIARRAGYVPTQTTLEHHAFGMMLGNDGKPFKTRCGGTVKLAELLDEALQRADQLISIKSPHLSPEQHQQVVNAVAMGAIKYADLSKNRTTDYCFDWDNMLSLEGNTAPYLQYAYSRICAIFRRAELHFTELPGSIDLGEAIEKNLALKLLQFEETLYQVANYGMPHLMCHYLYELAGLFSNFYETCPILNNTEQKIRTSRLRLAALTAKTLQQGLETLGIQTVEQL